MTTSAPLLNALAWSLFHFLWQGAAIAALAAAAIPVLRRPAARYLLGVGALALMLVSFGVTLALLSGAPAADYLPAARAPAAALASAPDAVAAPVAMLVESQAATPSGALAWIAWAWLAGVACFALRVVFGLLALERLRRRSLSALPAELVARFCALQERLGIRRVIRFCRCELVSVPAVIGFFRPVVLLPMQALTGLSAMQLEAVIAHELGHIKRFDVAVNFVQVIAETLLFFHPAVWWLNGRIRADREDCCDDVAVAACGSRVEYARALATLEGWRAMPHFAMAATGSSVASRVARLLGVARGRDGERASGAVAATLVLAGALLAGAFSLGLVQTAAAQSTRDDSSTTLVAEPEAVAMLVQAADPVMAPDPKAAPDPRPMPAPQAAPAPAAVPAPAAAPAPPDAPAPAAAPAPPAAPAPKAKPRAPSPPKPPAQAIPETPATRGPSYIEQMKSAGLEDLDVDHLVALRNQDVTPEYIRGIRAAGLNPDTDELIAMKVHDVTPEYTQSVRAMGFAVDERELIAFKVHDISAEFVKSLRDLGIDANAHEIIAMRNHGITPDYVRKMRAAGFTADAGELIALKIQDVTPEYWRAIEAAGVKVNPSQLIHAKVMDITPAFIAKMRRHGFKDLSLDQLIQLKNADVL